MIDKKLHTKIDDVVADIAESMMKENPEVKSELIKELTKGFDSNGLKMTRDTLKAFSEGVGFAYYAMRDVTNKESKESVDGLLAVAMATLKMLAREAKK